MARLSMEEVRARRPQLDEDDREAQDALRKLTTKLVAAWAEEHETHDPDIEWPDLRIGQGEAPGGYTYYQPKGRFGDRCIWTTRRMFDGKFWAMRFVYRATGVHARQMVLVKSSIRRRAKRQDAKEIATRYFVQSEERR